MVLVTIEIIILIILLGLSGFFSSSETALFSLSKVQREKIQASNPAHGKIINDLLNTPRALIITILLGNEFVNICFSSLFTLIVIQIAGTVLPWANYLIALPLVLLLGEITPKTLAIKNNERLSLKIARPLSQIMVIFTPIRWFIRNISDRIVNLVVSDVNQRENILTEDVIRSLLEDSEKEGVIDSDESEMISNVFDFGDLIAADVMTPRSLIFSLPVNMPLPEIVVAIKNRHISKVPIYEDSPDNIIGILFATDLVGISVNATDSEATPGNLRNLLRPPFFVPKTKRVDELFHVFQSKRISMAIVRDEDGKVQGLITIEDLLEEIFGEISDEFEVKKEEFEKINDQIYRVRGTLPITRFNELLKACIPVDEFETIGGFVSSLFDELPAVNAQRIYDSWQFTVEKIENNRIEILLVKRL
ncbi:MAG TPA: hemolysin family protein [Candidatus Marinimicrobia bacterium]|nr:hemolysin family protein [Candidatus Neomarinimicrobiota bacterium]HRS52501.1 hemolysin family protein [Candidatus Neomarinimicrobiota bacterium]HRU93102.1 hemolysin family protein [Candidatus Neomarinimicrobiota bacterium]